jgi:hypothetical protein
MLRFSASSDVWTHKFGHTNIKLCILDYKNVKLDRLSEIELKILVE